MKLGFITTKPSSYLRSVDDAVDEFDVLEQSVSCSQSIKLVAELKLNGTVENFSTIE